MPEPLLQPPPAAEATSATTRSAGFFGNLESLRGVCALAIVVIHFPFANHLARIPGVHQAWLFVDLFFVLSGFVIAHVYLTRINSAADAAGFAIKRFFRLYPLHLATTLAMAALLLARYVLHPANTVAEYRIDREFWVLAVANLGLVQTWLLPDRMILNTASWSISTELLAYMVFAGVCVFVPRRALRVIPIAGIVVVALMAMVAFEGATLDGDMRWRVVRCLYGFGLGVAAWWLSRRATTIGPGANTFVQGSTLFALIALLPLSASLPQLSLAFPPLTMVLVTAMATDRGSALRAFWEAAPLRLLGRLSYSIYLVHGPLITSAGAFINARMPWVLTDPWAGDVAATILIVATVGISALTYSLIEVPGRKLGQRLAARLERRTRRRTDGIATA